MAKAVDKGKPDRAEVSGHGHTPSESVQMELADDLEALLEQCNLKNLQGSPAKESGKTGSAKRGEGGSPWPRTPRGARPGSIPQDPQHAKFHALPELYCMPKFRPQWQEIGDLRHRMRQILAQLIYKDGARLCPEHEMAVREVLKYHNKSGEETGPGIDHVKIQMIHDDSTEIDLSYHQCLEEKAAEQCPGLLPHYDSLYKGHESELAQRRNTGACDRYIT